jgi:RNA polymerase sigma-70 factor (ECF subfamily)
MASERRWGDPLVWTKAVESADVASLTVAVGYRMGPDLRRRVAPEDIVQEALLRAWQKRDSFEPRDGTSFRNWLLTIARNCVEDHRDAAHALKRGGGAPQTEGGSAAAGNRPGEPEPWTSTTPSRVAAARERAEGMRRALDSLPEDCREVVRLRLFEELRIEEVGRLLGLGPETVRRRFRKGAELYRDRLARELGGSEARGA